MPFCRMPAAHSSHQRLSVRSLAWDSMIVSGHLFEVGDGRADLDAIGIEQQMQQVLLF